MRIISGPFIRLMRVILAMGGGLALLLACGGGGGGSTQPLPSATAPKLVSSTYLCPEDTPSFNLIVIGANFSKNSVVLVNGKERATTYLGMDRLSVLIDRLDVVGTCQVRNPPPGNEVSGIATILSAPLNAKAAHPIMSPTRVTQGSGDFGLGFWGIPIDKDSVILWNGRVMPTTVDLTTGYAHATIPASDVTLPGYGVAALYNSGTALAGCTPAQVVNITFDQQVSGMVESPGGGQLLCVVPASSPTFASNLLSIDPGTGAMASLKVLAGDPSLILNSGDKQTFYVGSNSTSLVERYAWPSLTLNQEFNVNLGHPIQMLELPGSPGSLLINQWGGPFGPAGLVIYDNGIPRAKQSAIYGFGNCLAVNADATRAYGYENGLSSQEFVAYSIDGTGLAELSRTGNLITGNADIAYAGGSIYSSYGAVIDPATTSVQSPGPLAPSDSKLLIDVTNDRMYFFGSMDYQTKIILIYRLSTLEQIGSLPVHGMTGLPGTLVRWGKNGLAATSKPGSGTGSPIYLFQCDYVAPSH